MNRKQTILSVVFIVLISGGLTTYIFSTEPEAETEGATRQSAMLVDHTYGETGSFRPIIKATGTVEASRDINLSTRVSGEVMRISEKYVPGGSVREGEILVQLDPADYENRVNLRLSDLSVAEAQLELEMGMQEAAKSDFEMATNAELVKNKALILREPQLKTARANVLAAESNLRQAQLDLRRTTIRAPFDAQVITRAINKGSQVNVGDILGRLVGNDEYWVRLNVPVSLVSSLSFSKRDQVGNKVTLRNASWPEGDYREGTLFQLVGTVTDQTRFAQVIVKVEEPMIATVGKPRLIMGTFLEASIPARELSDVIRIDREHLRKDNTVWIKQDEKLNVRVVKVAFEDENYVYISDGLAADEQIITTNISTVVEGAAVRSADEAQESE